MLCYRMTDISNISVRLCLLCYRMTDISNISVRLCLLCYIGSEISAMLCIDRHLNYSHTRHRVCSGYIYGHCWIFVPQEVRFVSFFKPEVFYK